ncbi:MAG: hypothetical protein J7497_16865, partial [Chitinophagaceae bacterium]|nr:hypothetical protein [Chitinophagaceae bacterium]
ILQRLVDTPRNFLYHFTTYEKKIFYLFVRYLFDSKLEDDELLKELNEYLFLNQKSRLETSFMEGQNLQIHFKENTNLRMDILYFMTCVLRRSNDHVKAIDIIDQEEKLHGRIDTRLIHSRALCYKSWYYHSTVNGHEVPAGHLKQALDDFLKCEIEYAEIQKEGNQDILMGEIMSGISNSIIDTYTKLYLKDPEMYQPDISTGRQRLIELKKTILLAAGADYESYLAFGHTEIDLEYCEALIAVKNNQPIVAREKIQEANGRLERILQTKGFELYPAFSLSEDRIRRLAKRLLK